MSLSGHTVTYGRYLTWHSSLYLNAPWLGCLLIGPVHCTLLSVSSELRLEFVESFSRLLLASSCLCGSCFLGSVSCSPIFVLHLPLTSEAASTSANTGFSVKDYVFLFCLLSFPLLSFMFIF